MQKKNQKVVMIVLLSVVMLSVGVWQWQSMSGTTAEPAQKKGNEQTGQDSGQTEQSQPSEPGTGSPEPGRMQVASLEPLPMRDPFTPDPNLIKNPEQPPAASRPVVVSNGTHRTISGSLPPLPPMSMPDNNMRIEMTDPDVKPEPPTPDWQVMGVVQGPNTIAIVKDSDGNRRFVRQGETLGNGFRVEAVRRGEIVVRGHGQKHTLKVGSGRTENEE